MVFLVRKAALAFEGELPECLQEPLARARNVALLEPRPAGFPLLFTAEMTLIEEAVAFLHFHGVQRARTEETIRTYCEILYDWFDTLEQSGIDWRQANASHLLGYRNRMLKEASPHTGRRYKVSTINHRIRGVLRFYRWLYKNRMLNTPLAQRADRLAETQRLPKRGLMRGATDNDFALRQYEQLPSPLTKVEVRELLTHLKPPYDLMARWQVYTGLRVSELLALQIEILDLVPSPSGIFHIPVMRKGRKEGYILAPISLIDETRMFVTTYRSAWLARRGNNHRRNTAVADQRALFVGRSGGPVKKNTYQCAVKSAARNRGIGATTHVLRATFACTMLARLEQLAANGAAINPLLIVKILMGHQHIETTDRYLRVVAADRESIEDALVTLVGDLPT
jgi:site-specific recombinase XerD